MAEPLKRTPFYDFHVAAGAKIVPFAGFQMPVQYPTGITAEHNAVRQRAGLFDVSHMGEFEVTGPDALAFVSRVTANDPAALDVGQAQYSCFLHENGGIVDDCLVYRLADRFMIVVNAANIAKDWAHITAQLGNDDARLVDRSDDTALLALQGPLAQAVLQPLCPGVDLEAIGYYRFAMCEVAGVPCILSRTGYTGEDGFELYHSPDEAARLWNALLSGGGVTLTGLGARDSLRLEMAYPLYGNDIDDQTTPLEAGLGWIVRMRKADFVGKTALAEQKAKGLRRRLVGFRLKERGFPRHGHSVYVRGEPCGHVRSGTVSPSIGEAIGTAYLPAGREATGTAFEIEIRGRRLEAEVVETPFWRRGSHR